MPSASNKTENKAPPEAHDPFKAAQSVVEKKVRNLEKRKGKLDLIREKRDQGEQLNVDQQKAIDAYDGVISSLEVTKDLQKQFGEIQLEIEKQLKKQARKEKKERAEKRAADVRRVQEMLQLQSLLDCLGTDQVREHFKAGKHSAKILTEENLTQLDDFYKLISPSRDEAKYAEQLGNAAEHIFSYLEGKEAEAAGSTYCNLKSLVDEILACGYFDNYPYEDEPEVVEELDAPAPVLAEEPEPELEQEPVHEEPPQSVVGEPHVEEPARPVMVEQVVQHAVPQHVVPHPTVQHAAPDMAGQLMDNADPTQYTEDDSFFSTPTFPPTEQRPFQDIVSSVQGTFNFLQESQIAEDSAPHHDPAVVAAKPMASSLHKSQTDAMHGTSFQGVSMLGNDDLTQQLAQSTQQQVTSQSDRLGDPTNPNTTQHSASLDAAYTPTPQDYSQNLMSSSAHTYGEQGSALGHSHAHSHAGMDQTVVMATGMSAAQDMTHSMPLQNQSQNIQDQGISQDTQGKKIFTMNPNAATFQSMYNTNISHNQTNAQMSPQSMGSSSSNSAMQQDKGMNQQNEFQSNGFGNNYGGRSGGMRGGSRGGGGRGGRGGMSNGYARNGSRGGGGGPYNSGRGGNFSSRGGSGRGTMRGGPPRGGSGGERSDRSGRGSSRGGYGGRPPVHQSA